MVSNDGWIEDAQTINSNGYIIKYNDAWENGFDYWSAFLAGKGLKIGIYYNPMWLTKAAYDQNILVKGTPYHARAIAGPASFNGALYWVMFFSGLTSWRTMAPANIPSHFGGSERPPATICY
jgi:hypothetical protein